MRERGMRLSHPLLKQTVVELSKACELSSGHARSCLVSSAHSWTLALLSASEKRRRILTGSTFRESLTTIQRSCHRISPERLFLCDVPRFLSRFLCRLPRSPFEARSPHIRERPEKINQKTQNKIPRAVPPSRWRRPDCYITALFTLQGVGVFDKNKQLSKQ